MIQTNIQDLTDAVVRDFQSYVAIISKERSFFDKTHTARKYEQLKMVIDGVLSPVEILEDYKLGTIEEHVLFDSTTATLPTTSNQWASILTQRRGDLGTVLSFVDQDLMQTIERAIPRLKSTLGMVQI